MAKIFKAAALLMILLCITGCSKVVTPLFPKEDTVFTGEYISIDISFKGNVDPVLNKYYIIFNNNAAPQIPFMPIQFVEPGETPSQPDEDYYGKYYLSWTAYLVLDGNALSFVKGPFTTEAVPTKEMVAQWSGAETQKITVTMDLSKLAPITSRLNFDFVSVDKETKLVKDNLSPVNSSFSPYYIFTVSDSLVSGSDEVMAVSSESSDITDWRVYIK